MQLSLFFSSLPPRYSESSTLDFLRAPANTSPSHPSTGIFAAPLATSRLFPSPTFPGTPQANSSREPNQKSAPRTARDRADPRDRQARPFPHTALATLLVIFPTVPCVWSLAPCRSHYLTCSRSLRS